MNDGDCEDLIEMAVQLAARLPAEMIAVVNRAILQSPGAASPCARTRIAQDIPHPYYRDIATDFRELLAEHGTAPFAPGGIGSVC